MVSAINSVAYQLFHLISQRGVRPLARARRIAGGACLGFGCARGGAGATPASSALAPGDGQFQSSRVNRLILFGRRGDVAAVVGMCEIDGPKFDIDRIVARTRLAAIIEFAQFSV